MNTLISPRLGRIFGGFFLIGIYGFGGVLPHARRMLVERLRWLDEHEFTHLLGLGQFLPGPNIVNMAVVIGQKFHGWRGACAAVSGLMLAPFIIVLTLASLSAQFADLPVLGKLLAAVAAGGAGLMLATGAKLIRSLPRRAWAIVIALAAFLAIAWWRVPLLTTLAVLTPLSLLCGWLSVRRELRETSK